MYLFHDESRTLSVLLCHLLGLYGAREFGTKGEMSQRDVFERNVKLGGALCQLVADPGRDL